MSGRTRCATRLRNCNTRHYCRQTIVAIVRHFSYGNLSRRGCRFAVSISLFPYRLSAVRLDCISICRFFGSASTRAAAMKAPPTNPKITSRKPARTVASKDSAKSKPRSTAMIPPNAPTRESAGLQWTFLTNHSHVLVLLSRNPSVVLREVALQVGITERAVQRIIADLEAGGVIEREKVGRQNHYRIRADQPLRHSIESHRTIGELLALLNSSDE